MYTRGREVVNGSTPAPPPGLAGAARPRRGVARPAGPWLHERMPARPGSARLRAGIPATRWRAGAARVALAAALAVVGAAGAAIALAACGGAASRSPAVVLTPPPEPLSRGTFVGPLCEAQVCRCRQGGMTAGDDGVGEPAEGSGVKRFEIRIGPSEHALWVTLDDMVLYKSTARAEDCFYVDLGPGEHRMGLRASQPGGVAARVEVSEYAPATRSWYRTFTFACGAPGVCSHADLDAYKAGLARFARGIHDPCGSVKVKALGWDVGRAPDQQHPDDLQVGWTLQLYGFAPRHPHGHPACAERNE